MRHYFRVSKKPDKSSIFSNLRLTTVLIIINLAIFLIINIFLSLLEIFDFNKCEGLCNLLVLQPNNLFNNGYIWTLLTSMFIHANFFHLLVNMFSLYFIGNFLEILIGKKRFFWFYIFSGIFASLFFSFLSFYFGTSGIGMKIFGNPLIPAVGASGALFGIAGVLALLTPRSKVYLIAGPLIAIILEAVLYGIFKNNFLLGILDFVIMIYVFISLFAIMSFNSRLQKLALPVEMRFWALPIFAIVPLIIISFFVELPIGNMAHLGGFIAGVFYGFYLKIKYKKKTRLIAQTFSR